MLKNYFKTAWRNITRNKVNSFINIAGLAIGMACFVLILLYVKDERAFDRFLDQSDRICQVNLDANFGGQQFVSGTTPPPVGAALKNSFPEIEAYTRALPAVETVVRNESAARPTYFNESQVLAVDSNFLEVLSFPFKEGNASTCLHYPGNLVITEQAARKYFGNSPAIGRTLTFGDSHKPYTVTAVLRDLPANSSLQFTMLQPIAAYGVVSHFSWSWVWAQLVTYVRVSGSVVKDPAALAALEAKFPAMVKQQAAGAFRRIGQPFDEFLKKGGKWDFHLQPLTDIHLHSAGIDTIYKNTGDNQYVYIFSAIAIFIILLACVNFMNLATAESSKRAREVGIRKVLGSLQGQLVRQFLAEALLYSIVAGATALCLVALLLPSFNRLAEKSISLGLVFSGSTGLLLIALVLITGLLAGSYPAFYLSSFKPVAVLKGVKLFGATFGHRLVRNGLVVFQFTVSTALIICTLVVYRQLQLSRTIDLGLNKENVLFIPNSYRLGKAEEAFRREVMDLPEVSSASIADNIPTQSSFTDFYVPQPANDGVQVPKDITLSSYMVDDDFVPTLGLRVLKGRNFSRDFNDSSSIIINEMTARQIGWKDAIGKFIAYPGSSNSHEVFQVIGVVKDFNVQSIHSIITPFALFHASSKSYHQPTSYLLIRAKPGNPATLISRLESKWKSFAPATPFSYNFLDSGFDALYRADKHMGTVFGIFTLLSVFVACLGLFGLAAFTAERRTREVGVRKVLGASVSGLVFLLSKDFIKLVLLAALIAFPIAWWGMNKWLAAFAYRITISPWIFAEAGIMALFIAMATVSFQAGRAAMANPVKSLRTE